EAISRALEGDAVVFALIAGEVMLMASSTPLQGLLDGLVEVGGERSFLPVVDDPYVQHRRRRDAGRADGAGPEGRLETEFEAEGGEADAFVLVPLRQRPARVGAPLPGTRHLVHGADQSQAVVGLRVDQRLRVARVEDGLRVRRVHEMTERVGTRYGSGFEPRGDRGRRVAITRDARPGVTEQAGRGITLPRSRHPRDR